MSVTQSSGGTPAGGIDGELSESDIFDILSNDRRRYALHYLLREGTEEGPTVRELSRYVAAWENETPPERVEAKQRRRVHIALHQTHLPRMDRADVVEYDPASDTVELSGNAEDLRVYMEVVSGEEIPWSQFYVGLAVLSLGCLAASAVGLPPFDWIRGLGFAVLTSLSFLATGVVHTRHMRRHRVGSDGPPPKRR
jgi:hypothetical protein